MFTIITVSTNAIIVFIIIAFNMTDIMTHAHTQLTVHTNLGEGFSEGPITTHASKCAHTHPVGKLVFIKTRFVTWKASFFAFHVLKLMRETHPVGPRWCQEFAGRDSNFVKDRSTVLMTEFNWPSNSYSEEVTYDSLLKAAGCIGRLFQWPLGIQIGASLLCADLTQSFRYLK
jgi:hypothetical protein